MDKKRIALFFSVIIGIIVVYFGYGEYEEYAKKKELENELNFLQGEIDKIDRGETSEYAESLREVKVNDALSRLSLSNFSARSDGTYVKAFGSITNSSSQPIDEIIDIAFFDENDGIIRVKKMIIKLNAGENMYFEELIGLTRDGTVVPKSAKLTN